MLLVVALGALLLGRFVPREIVLLLPLVAVLVAVLAGSGSLLPARVPLALLVLSAWIVTSWFWSADRAGSLRAFAFLVVALSVGLVCGFLVDLGAAQRVVACVVKLVLTANVVALVVAPGWSTRPPEEDPVVGWHGIFGHKNELGGFLVLAVAVLLCEAGRRRLVWLLVVVVLLAGSQSASAVGVALVLSAVVLWRSSLRGMDQVALRAAARLVSVMLVAVGAAFVVAAPSLVAQTFGRSTTFTGRTEIWAAVQRQIGLHPVLGQGWGGVWRESSPPTQEIWREARFRAFYAHNGYLDLVLQIGSVGAALFLLVLLVAAVRLVRREPSGQAFWGVLLLLGLSLQAITESGPFTGALGLLLLAYLATAAVQGVGPVQEAQHHRAPTARSIRSHPHPLRPSRPAATAAG